MVRSLGSACSSLALGLICLAAHLVPPALGQASEVAPAAQYTLEVNGEPFYPLGWNMLGTCPDDPDHVAWDVVVGQMEHLRRTGTNTILEPGSTDGRFLPRRVGEQNLWQTYTYQDVDGASAQRGHPMPGAYVAGMRRLMDLAYYGPEGTTPRPIFTIVPLHRFIVPEGTRNDGIGGSTVLRCDAYSRLIEDERRLHAEARSDLADWMVPVRCDGPEALPYWEWTVRYVVQSLRDHPGLLVWYLWDEPEGQGRRHLFGIVEPGSPVRPYTGPESLPTPDLLRYAYDRVVAFEIEGRPAAYSRHPVIVDIYEPEVFFSDRFSWSRAGDRRPEHHAGPFDRTPEGTYRTPADILGLDGSGALMQTAPRGGEPAHGWYWDPNIPSRKAEMIREAVERDGLWSSLVVAGQGQLSTEAPFALPNPPRCPNPKRRLRLLNDRDLVWHLLTLQINGLRGHLYYARALAPEAGPGAEQIARTDRLVEQFVSAGFDQVFRTPRITEAWQVESITVAALTNYFRSDPMFVGPADAYDPGLSALSRSVRLDPADYVVRNFGRHAGAVGYGHATMQPSGPTTHEEHELLRTALHRHGGRLYLFVSNDFDARISAELWFEPPLVPFSAPEEARFDLDAGGRFVWSAADRVVVSRQSNGVALAVELEPYEARVLRLAP